MPDFSWNKSIFKGSCRLLKLRLNEQQTPSLVLWLWISIYFIKYFSGKEIPGKRAR